MKILYIAHDRGGAELAARALSGMAPDLAVTWTRSPASALHWLDANREGAIVILDTAVHPGGCRAFVEQVRGSRPEIPLVLVLESGRPEHAAEPLTAGADGYVVAGDGFEAGLRTLVAGLIERRRVRQDALARHSNEIAAARTEAAERVARAEEERDAAERRSVAEVAAAATRLAEIEARHSASLAREARICTALQQQLMELETAARTAEERRAADAVAAADLLAKRHAEFTASLAQASQWRDTLTAKLTQVTDALEEAHEARRAAAAAAAEHLARREAELSASLAEAVVARMALERAVADANAARRTAEQRAAADLAAAGERQAALEDLLAQESDRRTGLEQSLAAAESTRQDTEHRHAAELTAAAMRLADLQSRYDAEQSTGAAARAVLEQQLQQAAAALAQLEQRAADEANDARRREADLAGRLDGESQARAGVERDLAATRTDAARSRKRLLGVAAAHRRRGREQTGRLQGELAALRSDADRQLRANEEEIRELRLERERLQELVARTSQELQALHTTLEDERVASERAQTVAHSEFQRVFGECEQLRDSLAHLQTSFQMLEHVAGEHALERAKLEGALAERDSQLSAQADRHAALEQASQQALAQLQDRLQQTVETGNAEIARLRAAVDALQRELEAAGREAAALRTEADRVPVLRQELQANRNERRREFERAPHAMCRCTPEGVIAEANHALVALLGRRRTDDLVGLEFAAAASDYAGDLGWVIERARTTRKTESVEAHWKTRDGRRLLARVHALVTDGGVEIVVEDITRMRALEERLRQSERLEAAGRLAAEVAVTCEALLRDVTRDGHEWLAALGRENELHGRGELLLTEVARAASFLRQLGVFSNKQVIEGQPVSVPHVLRDLAPVLRRVVGEHIEVVVPRSSGSFDVEVDAERIERVLVTVASYARDRMPGGGQVKIELASTIVGRKFVARHPHVRPGPHVVITVSELRRTGTPREAAEELPEPADNPGMELRGLAEIVSQCGGHLWLEAERDGNMVVKIHLPRRASSDLAAIEPDGRTERSGRLARWFRGTSAAVNS